jgi:predicted dehydrogenase
MLKMALIGCGSIANAHVDGYKGLFSGGLRTINVSAVCDINIKNAKSKAESIGEFQKEKPKIYTSYENLVKEESLDAVDVCLPHNLHHIVVTYCLERDLHVIVEKPLGITMRAGKILVDKVKKHNQILAVAENYRREPNARAIHWAIEQGLIGKPRFVVWMGISFRASPGGWREKKLVSGGSWVFDGGVHWADLDRYLLGKEATDVVAMTHTFNPIKKGVKVTVDDMTMGIVRFEDDIYSQWLCTNAAPGKGMGLHNIYGSKGSTSNQEITIQKEEDLVEKQSIASLEKQMRDNLDAETLERYFPNGVTNSFSTELYDFYNAIKNRGKPEVDALEGYRDMAIPIGFYESAKSRNLVKIKDVLELRIEDYQGEINDKLGI